jgi:hypothetical protein
MGKTFICKNLFMSMKSGLSEEKALIWKSKDKELKIKSLKELLDMLIGIKQENIDNEIDDNKDRLISWVEENFSEKFELIAELKSSAKEFTSQQFREKVIRILRKFI